MSWTQEKTNQLKILWDAGESASSIAKKIGGGVTRNAVIGKIHRLGVAGRQTKPSSGGSSENTRRPAMTAKKNFTDSVKLKTVKPTKKTFVKLSDPAKIYSREIIKKQIRHPRTEFDELHRHKKNPGHSQKIVSLLELSENSCRWPIGDPKESGFGFCGSDIGENRSYCASHTTLAYSSGGKKTSKNKTGPETPYFGRKSALKALNFI